MKNEFKKGDEIKFLDYTIRFCTNNDGIIIFKDCNTPGFRPYECHLGNYATLDQAKRYAILHFMIRRPDTFATHVVHYITGGGTMSEFYAFRRCVIDEGLPMPDEIDCIDGLNSLIGFKGQKMYIDRESVDDKLHDEYAKVNQLIQAMTETATKLTDTINKFKS